MIMKTGEALKLAVENSGDSIGNIKDFTSAQNNMEGAFASYRIHSDLKQLLAIEGLHQGASKDSHSRMQRQ